MAMQLANKWLKPLCLGFMVLAAQSSYAGGFSVTPIKVNLSKDKKVMSLQVTNNSNEPTSVQAQLMQWQQQQGRDQQDTPSQDILVTPPIFTLAAGQSQVVRVGIRRPVQSSNELSYRLFLKEIPAPASQVNQAVNMVMQVSIPVFVAAQNSKAHSQIVWQLKKNNSHELCLIAENQGNTHRQFTALKLQLQHAETLQQSGNFYLLAGAQREWCFNPKTALTAAMQVKLNVTGLDKDDQSDLQLP